MRRGDDEGSSEEERRDKGRRKRSACKESELAKSVFADVTATMMAFLGSMKVRFIFLICASMSVG